MPLPLAIGFAVAQLIVTIGVAYFASKRGVTAGLQIGVAVHSAQLQELQAEVLRLREAKHAIAQRVTEHEAWIDVLKRKAGVV